MMQERVRLVGVNRSNVSRVVRGDSGKNSTSESRRRRTAWFANCFHGHIYRSAGPPRSNPMRVHPLVASDTSNMRKGIEATKAVLGHYGNLLRQHSVINFETRDRSRSTLRKPRFGVQIRRAYRREMILRKSVKGFWLDFGSGVRRRVL